MNDSKILIECEKYTPLDQLTSEERTKGRKPVWLERHTERVNDS